MTSTSASSPTMADRSVTGGGVVAALVLGGACAITYLIMLAVIGPAIGQAEGPSEIGAMWAVVATIFVFRATMARTLRSAVTRLAATTLSLMVCLAYLVLIPVTTVGVGLVIAVGALLALLLRQPQDAALTGITSIVVLVVADLGRAGERWLEPLLRLFDTAIGIGVGVLFAGLLLRVLRGLRGMRRQC